MTSPVTKLSRLREMMGAGDWRGAVLLAAKFPQLGAARGAVLSAREAYLRPDFQRQLGRNPAALIEGGKAALEERYGNV